MCNDTTVCDGRMDLKIVVRDLSDWWNSLDSEYAMMCLFTLMCWEYHEGPYQTSRNCVMGFLFKWVEQGFVHPT